MEQLPIFVNLSGSNVVLIGEGEAADAKRRLIERAGGKVVADCPLPVCQCAKIAFIALESDSKAMAQAARLRAKGMLVNVVDRPEYCDFTTPAIVDRSPVVIAIGTGGASAGLAKALRQRLEALFPQNLGDLAKRMSGVKDKMRVRFPDNANRRRSIDAAFAPSGPLDPMKDAAAERVDSWLESATDVDANRLVEISLLSNDPDDLTLRAARLLGEADHIFYSVDIDAELLDRARADAARYIGDPPSPLPKGLNIWLRLPTASWSGMTQPMSDDLNMEFPGNMLFFGCGNMGGAMLRGWIAAGIDPARFTVIDPVALDIPAGVRHFKNVAGLDSVADVVILAVKPQLLPTLRADIAACLSDDAMLISIMAGTSIETLSTNFPGTRIARLMPNLAAAIGKSPMALTSQALSEAERDNVSIWMAPLGAPIWIADESHMDAVTALAGSGPAFVYRFIDALAAGGVALGLDPEVSNKLALSMVEGAAILAAQSPESPQELADRVTSSGGTTAAGIAILDDQDLFTKLIEMTLSAARDRGVELGRTVA